jgi:hypothetical protein
MTLSIKDLYVTLSITMLCIILNVVLLSITFYILLCCVMMLNGIVLSINMLNVILLSVVALIFIRFLNVQNSLICFCFFFLLGQLSSPECLAQ